MSDSNSTPTPFRSLPRDWAAEEAQRRKRHAEFREINRAAIFDALEAAGLETVTVSFDGSGDSGQIEGIEAQGAKPEALQTVEVPFASIPWGKTEPECAPMNLAKAIEELTYDVLGEQYGGWQDNEGSYGEFTFDVGRRRITLALNERYVASDSSGHEI
jgi:hypothetical protein